MNTQNWLRSVAKKMNARAMHDMDAAQCNVGALRGYYLVVESTGNRHWLGSTFWDAVRNLNKACDKHLTDDKYQYLVDHSLGLDVHGLPAWSNVDHSDSLLDAETCAAC